MSFFGFGKKKDAAKDDKGDKKDDEEKDDKEEEEKDEDKEDERINVNIIFISRLPAPEEPVSNKDFTWYGGTAGDDSVWGLDM